MNSISGRRNIKRENMVCKVAAMRLRSDCTGVPQTSGAGDARTASLLQYKRKKKLPTASSECFATPTSTS